MSIFLAGRRKIGKIKRFFRGSKGDPFLYLGGLVAIFFGILVLVTFPVLESLDQRPNLFLAQSFIPSGEDLFLGKKDLLFREGIELSLVGGSALVGVSSPVSQNPRVFGTLIDHWGRREVIEYIVEPGDNLWTLAKRFGISLNTILWANNLSKWKPIQPGQKLIILPVSGVIHHVKKGDTLSKIAKRYKADLEKILVFNDLSSEDEITIGDILIIPGGKMPYTPRYAPKLVPLAKSYFICPISPPCRITRGLHWYNAIDFSHGKCGEPVFAAAAGKVLKVKITSSRSRWAFGGAGNHLTILHPNGVITYYGHILKALVSPGEEVSQGQIIALIGGRPGTPGAGKSTGCHLHFGVRGAKNPFR
jgi:LysM repeat protein